MTPWHTRARGTTSEAPASSPSARLTIADVRAGVGRVSAESRDRLRDDRRACRLGATTRSCSVMRCRATRTSGGWRESDARERPAGPTGLAWSPGWRLFGDPTPPRHRRSSRAGGTRSSARARRSTPNRYFVICATSWRLLRFDRAELGRSPETGSLMALRFPSSRSRTWSTCRPALLDELGIEKLLAVASGGSMGGMQALAWAKRYPDRVRFCLAIATTWRLAAQAIAFNEVGGRRFSAMPTSTTATTTIRPHPEHGLGRRPHDRTHHVPVRRVDARQVRPQAARPRGARIRVRHRVRGRELPRVPGQSASPSASTPTPTCT
jgi:hypothetical protein